MKPYKLIAVLMLVVAIALLIWLVIANRNQGQKHTTIPTTNTSSTTKPLTANGQPVPVQSVQRAKSAGYYCPSWDAKPGSIVPTVCYKLDN